MAAQTTIYRQATLIAEDYLGPVAPRFMDRIIENHLHKSPNEVTSQDMPNLITWVQLSISLITDQQDDIAQFVSRLRQLADKATVT